MVQRLKKKYGPLISLFVGALCVRFAWWFFVLRTNPLMCDFDAGHYLEMARAFVEHHAFINHDQIPFLYRLPGYPLFLGLFQKYFCLDLSALQLVQTFIAACIPVQMFYAARLLTGSYRLALTASWIGVFHLGLNLYAGMFMTETLFCTVFLMFITLLAHKKIQTNKLRQFGAALLWSVLVLIRPIEALSVLLVLCALAYFGFKRGMQLIFCGAALPVAWVIRNYVVTGFVVLHTLQGPHLINHGAVPVVMAATASTHSQAQDMVYARLNNNKKKYPPLPAHAREAQENMIKIQTALEFFLQYPYHLVLHGLKNSFKTVAALYSSELLAIYSHGQLPEYNNDSLSVRALKYLMPHHVPSAVKYIIWLEIIFHMLLLLGSFGFILTRWRQLINGLYVLEHRSCLYALLFLLSGALVASSGFCGYARFRLPVELFWIMIACEFFFSTTSVFSRGVNEVSS